MSRQHRHGRGRRHKKANWSVRRPRPTDTPYTQTEYAKSNPKPKLAKLAKLVDRFK